MWNRTKFRTKFCMETKKDLYYYIQFQGTYLDGDEGN